jgi:hypothetical protein
MCFAAEFVIALGIMLGVKPLFPPLLCTSVNSAMSVPKGEMGSHNAG